MAEFYIEYPLGNNEWGVMEDEFEGYLDFYRYKAHAERLSDEEMLAYLDELTEDIERYRQNILANKSEKENNEKLHFRNK